jgi:hypothetical protein
VTTLDHPTPEMLALLAELRESEEARAAFRAAACDHTSPHFGVAWQILAAYDEDRPKRAVHLIVGGT